MLHQKLCISKKAKKVTPRIAAAVLALMSSYSFVSAATEHLDLTAEDTTHPNNVRITVDDKDRTITTTTIGFDNYATNNAAAIGYKNSAINEAVALGVSNNATSWGVYGGVAVGRLNKALVGAVSVGYNNYSSSKSTVVGIDSRAVGGIAIGNNASSSKWNVSDKFTDVTQTDSAMAIGNSSSAITGMALGTSAKSYRSGTAVGNSSNALYGGVALGSGAKTGSEAYDPYRGGGVALGQYSYANRASGSYGYVPLNDELNSTLATNPDTMASDIALAKATGNQTVIDGVNAFYDKYKDAYAGWQTLRQDYVTKLKAYDDQVAKMTAKTYASEADRQEDYNTLKELENAKKVAIKALQAYEKDNINESAVTLKDSLLSTYKSTYGAVSVGADGKTRQIINVAAGTEDTDAVNVAQLKTVATKVSENSDKIAENTTKIDNIKTRVDNIDNSIKNIVNGEGNLNIEGDKDTGVVISAVDPKDASKGVKVSLGDTIKAGDVSIGTKDGASTITGLTNITWDPTKAQADRAATEGQLKDALGQVNGLVTPTKITGDGNIQVKENGKNDFSLSLNKDLKVENSISVGGNTYITNEGINANNQVIQNVGESDLVSGSYNAATVNQVVTVRDELQKSIDNVASETMNNSQQISRLGTEVNKVAAGAAALAALHPLDFDSNEKLTFAVGMGAYKSETAAAIGAFYRPNNDIMFNFATAVGNNDNMYNAGVSFKFGESSPYNNMSKTEMANKLEAQDKNIASLQADNDELKARLAKLEAAIAK